MHSGTACVMLHCNDYDDSRHKHGREERSLCHYGELISWTACLQVWWTTMVLGAQQNWRHKRWQGCLLVTLHWLCQWYRSGDTCALMLATKYLKGCFHTLQKFIVSRMCRIMCIFSLQLNSPHRLFWPRNFTCLDCRMEGFKSQLVPDFIQGFPIPPVCR